MLLAHHGRRRVEQFTPPLNGLAFNAGLWRIYSNGTAVDVAQGAWQKQSDSLYYTYLNGVEIGLSDSSQAEYFTLDTDAPVQFTNGNVSGGLFSNNTGIAKIIARDALGARWRNVGSGHSVDIVDGVAYAYKADNSTDHWHNYNNGIDQGYLQGLYFVDVGDGHAAVWHKFVDGEVDYSFTGNLYVSGDSLWHGFTNGTDTGVLDGAVLIDMNDTYGTVYHSFTAGVHNGRLNGYVNVNLGISEGNQTLWHSFTQGTNNGQLLGYLVVDTGDGNGNAMHLFNYGVDEGALNGDYYPPLNVYGAGAYHWVNGQTTYSLGGYWRFVGSQDYAGYHLLPSGAGSDPWHVLANDYTDGGVLNGRYPVNIGDGHGVVFHNFSGGTPTGLTSGIFYQTNDVDPAWYYSFTAGVPTRMLGYQQANIGDGTGSKWRNFDIYDAPLLNGTVYFDGLWTSFFNGVNGGDISGLVQVDTGDGYGNVWHNMSGGVDQGPAQGLNLYVDSKWHNFTDGVLNTTPYTGYGQIDAGDGNGYCWHSFSAGVNTGVLNGYFTDLPGYEGSVMSLTNGQATYVDGYTSAVDGRWHQYSGGSDLGLLQGFYNSIGWEGLTFGLLYYFSDGQPNPHTGLYAQGDYWQMYDSGSPIYQVDGYAYLDVGDGNGTAGHIFSAGTLTSTLISAGIYRLRVLNYSNDLSGYYQFADNGVFVAADVTGYFQVDTGDGNGFVWHDIQGGVDAGALNGILQVDTGDGLLWRSFTAGSYNGVVDGLHLVGGSWRSYSNGTDNGVFSGVAQADTGDGYGNVWHSFTAGTDAGRLNGPKEVDTGDGNYIVWHYFSNGDPVSVADGSFQLDTGDGYGVVWHNIFSGVLQPALDGIAKVATNDGNGFVWHHMSHGTDNGVLTGYMQISLPPYEAYGVVWHQFTNGFDQGPLNLGGGPDSSGYYNDVGDGSGVQGYISGVIQTAPIILTQPQSGTYPTFESHNLTCVAVGLPNLTYTWYLYPYYPGTSIPIYTGQTFAATDTATRTYICVVSNDLGDTASTTATITRVAAWQAHNIVPYDVTYEKVANVNVAGTDYTQYLATYSRNGTAAGTYLSGPRSTNLASDESSTFNSDSFYNIAAPYEGLGFYAASTYWLSSNIGGGAVAATLYKSTDGIDWKPASADSAAGSINGMCYFGGRLYVAAISGGIYVSSADTRPLGELWTLCSGPGASTQYNDIYASSSGIVAVGQGGAVAYSTDGTSWNTTTVVGSTLQLYKVIEANGVWFAFGGQSVTTKNVYGTSSSQYTGVIYKSTNGGASWSLNFPALSAAPNISMTVLVSELVGLVKLPVSGLPGVYVFTRPNSWFTQGSTPDGNTWEANSSYNMSAVLVTNTGGNYHIPKASYWGPVSDTSSFHGAPRILVDDTTNTAAFLYTSSLGGSTVDQNSNNQDSTVYGLLGKVVSGSLGEDLSWGGGYGDGAASLSIAPTDYFTPGQAFTLNAGSTFIAGGGKFLAFAKPNDTNKLQLSKVCTLVPTT